MKALENQGNQNQPKYYKKNYANAVTLALGKKL